MHPTALVFLSLILVSYGFYTGFNPDIFRHRKMWVYSGTETKPPFPYTAQTTTIPLKEAYHESIQLETATVPQPPAVAVRPPFQQLRIGFKKYRNFQMGL